MSDSFDSEEFSALEKAAAPVWTMIDDFTTLFAEYKNSHDDVSSRLKAMRASYRSSLHLLHKLQPIERVIQQFARRIGRFESYISRTALNYGLELLPDEVLYEIFVLAATTLEEKVTLSLVCKRFRRVMMSSRKLWDGYWIETSQLPEQIIAIAEGHGFASLKARIYTPNDLPSGIESWIDEHAPDVGWWRTRYYKFSVGLILSFGLEELELSLEKSESSSEEFGFDLNGSDWEEIEPILAGGDMQNLRRLSILKGGVYQNWCDARLLGEWYMPLLQSLEVDFVPEAALARNLVRCEFVAVEEAEFDFLEEFLAGTNSLQDLKLFLSADTPRFYEVCDLPSLRSLEVNFIPHPSLARRLVRFRLALPYRFPLTELLDFLSSSEALEELAIHEISKKFNESFNTVDALPATTMPNLVSCVVLSYSMGPTFIAKFRTPVLRKLKLDTNGFDGLSTIIRNEFRTALQSMSSLEVLELDGELDVGLLDEIVRYAPPHLESFLLTRCGLDNGAEPSWNTSPTPNRKLIHFIGCTISSVFILTSVDYLKEIGLGGVKLQFSGCVGWRNGTFGLDEGLDEVISAFINHGGMDPEQSDPSTDSDQEESDSEQSDQ